MNRLSIMAVTTAWLILGVSLAGSSAVGQQNAQLTSDVEAVNAASQVLIAAISARDIGAIDRIWAHEAYATFMGPLSTTVVVGWDGVRKAWEMRFSQFDQVTISVAESHVRINGKAMDRRNREGPVATEEWRYAELRCFRDERVREPRWSLARGVPPGDSNLQGDQVAHIPLRP